MQNNKDMDNHLVVGVYGEDLAIDYLKGLGFELVARNIRYKWGELDIVAKRQGIVHFIEVKTRYVIHETSDEAIKPEDNMTRHKMAKFFRSVETFLGDMGGQESCDWQIDLIVVVITKDNKHRIGFYEDIVL